MQTIYKLIFLFLVLKAQKDELRKHAVAAVRASKRDLAAVKLHPDRTSLAAPR